MEMKNLIIFITSLVTFLMPCEAKKASGYIFASPRAFKIGFINQLQLLRFGNLDAGTVNVKLYYSVGYYDNQTLLSENDYNLPQGKKETFIKLFVAPFSKHKEFYGKIEISGKIGDEIVNGSSFIQLNAPRNNIIIIQTDKPFYKPGQEVKSRILKVDKNLKPSLKKSDLGDVFVTDPHGIRLFHFDKIPLGKGLHQLQFLLADKATLGKWKIHLKAGNDSETTTFDVKQYELPRFEMKILFPPFVFATASFIPIQVCANYTYGEPVIGQLNLKISLQQFGSKDYDYNSSTSSLSSFYSRFPVVQKSVRIHGCYEYTLNVSQIQTGEYEYFRSIIVVANFIEDGTGVRMTVTENLDRTTDPISLNLEFSSDGSSPSYFKPGLPYFGKLSVTNPDGTPAGGEPVSICCNVSKQIVIAKRLSKREVQYCKNFTSNDNGIVKYTIPPQSVDTLPIKLAAKSIKYASDPQNLLVQPRNFQVLNPFYSPSGSFIQLEGDGHTFLCGSKKYVKLLFTSKENAEFKFYYEVIREDIVVQSGIKKVAFKVEDDVSDKFQNENELINNSEEDPLPPSKSSSSSISSEYFEDNNPASKESEYLPLIGEVELEIDVDYSPTPAFTILVFYVRDDKETVADSQAFPVEKCLKHKVHFEFSNAALKPGENTTVKIKASPHSLCGWRVIDKSVTLLDKSNQLTEAAIFSRLIHMDTGISDFGVPCYEYYPQPGLPASSVITRTQGIDSEDFYIDSYGSFMDSGLLVISNLFVFTHPCPKNYGTDTYNNLPGSDLDEIYEDESLEFSSGEFESKENESASDVSSGGGVPLVSAINPRKNFPETWLFDMEMVGSNGIYKSKEALPDTVTEWIGNAVCVSPKDGLGISNTATINSFQLFFIEITLPISVIRGEEFFIGVSLFSYADGALPLTVSVDKPVGYQIVFDSINGDVCIQPGTKHSFRLRLKATTVGKINITVRAETAQSKNVCASSSVSDAFARDAITKSLYVKEEGFPVNGVKSAPVDPSGAA